MRFIFSDWGTAAHPSPVKQRDDIVPIPPERNIHYDWCLNNLEQGSWRIDFNYPYYDIFLREEDVTAFKIIFGCKIYE